MSSGSWGGWGIERLGNKLQQVALGAAKDLQELTASVQQVCAVCWTTGSAHTDE
jgi:hypothetical protein